LAFLRQYYWRFYANIIGVFTPILMAFVAPPRSGPAPPHIRRFAEGLSIQISPDKT
jgi:hypothetical protein